MSEADIQARILVAITALPGAFFYRNNTGAAFTREGRMIRFGLAGAPDILGCYRGRAIGIEVKAPRGGQREAQRRWQASIERAGGVYILARSVNDALDALAVVQ
jgi:hypothetical protein